MHIEPARANVPEKDFQIKQPDPRKLDRLKREKIKGRNEYWRVWRIRLRGRNRAWASHEILSGDFNQGSRRRRGLIFSSDVLTDFVHGVNPG